MKKKLLTALLLVAASASWINTLYAQEYNSSSGISGNPVKITRVYATANRPNFPQYSHMILFELSDMSWLPSTCNNTYIALPDTEKTVQAALLSAHIAKKPVVVWIDDTLKSGSYCHAEIIYTQDL